MKHVRRTKGRWKVDPSGRSIENQEGRRIAHNFYARKAGSSQKIPYEEIMGNAVMLAAGPSLEAVLREFVKDVEAVGVEFTADEWPDLACTYREARALLDTLPEEAS